MALWTGGSRRQIDRMRSLSVARTAARAAVWTKPVRSIRRLWLPLLAAAGTVPSITVSSSQVSAAADSRFIAVGAVAHIPSTARVVGALSPRRVIQLGVALAPRSPIALRELATGVSSPGSPLFHHFVDSATFASEFGATQATVQRVETMLRSEGLHPGPVSSNDLLVPVSASVGALQRAFRTKLVSYRLSGGDLGWAPTSAPMVPAYVASDVSAVVGLDNLVEPHALEVRRSSAPRLRASGTVASGRRRPNIAPVSCRAARVDARASGGWTDDELAKAYGLSGLFSSGDVGAGQTIALFELEPYLASDVAGFDRCYFGRSHSGQVSAVPVDGFRLSGAGSGESILDIENLSALAPAAKILVYEAPNTTFGAIDEYNQIVSEDRANIVSTSWGECESALEISAPGAEQVENSLFEEAATQGQTFVAAAGDTGSDDCASTPFNSTVAVKPYLSVDDPADQPFVVAAGGTSLATDAQPLAASAETVWNDGSIDGGGGGGFSAVWPIPAWQAGSGVPGVATTGYREVPDVSASADQRRGVTVYSQAFAPAGSPAHSGSVDSGWSTIGGTSSAAPIWAAVLADIAASGSVGTTCGQLPTDAGGPDLGFVAPELYEAAAREYSFSFNDVTVGDNDVFALGYGYSAAPGYDLATGLGSPTVQNPSGSPGLAATLCALATGLAIAGPHRPVITALSPAAGPVGGGNTVRIGLSSPVPPGSSVRVEFGAVQASVTSSSGENIVVTVPQAPLTAGSAVFAGAGPAAVRVLVSDAGQTASSLPGPASLYDYVNESPSGTTLPTVTGIGPDGGAFAGGNLVRIYGSGFSDGQVTVSIGGVPARGVEVQSDFELTAIAPRKISTTSCAVGPGFQPADSCQTEVVVTTTNGSSALAPILPAVSGPVVFSPQGVIAPEPGKEVAAATTEYDYSPPPVISSITPNPGPESGSSPVIIHGHGFNLVNFEWVNFGPPASSASEQVQIAYISGSRIEIDPPAESTNGSRILRGGVSVQTTAGLSNIVRFRFAGVPRVKKLSATTGPSSGGTTITLTGEDLAGVLSVSFIGERPLSGSGVSVSTEISGDTTTTVRVVVPPFPPGPVDVEPCTASGCAGPNPEVDTFVYYRRR